METLQEIGRREIWMGDRGYGMFFEMGDRFRNRGTLPLTNNYAVIPYHKLILAIKSLKVADLEYSCRHQQECGKKINMLRKCKWFLYVLVKVKLLEI